MSHDIDPVAKALIRSKIQQLIGRAGLTRQDSDDLEQDLSFHVHQRLSAFNPAKGNPTQFLATVIRHFAANLLRDRRADKRDYRRDQPQPHESGNEAPSGSTDAAQDAHDARLGRVRRSDEEQAQLVHDVASVLARLPAEMRALGDRLMHDSVSEVARATGVPRTTLNSMIGRMRVISKMRA